MLKNPEADFNCYLLLQPDYNSPRWRLLIFELILPGAYEPPKLDEMFLDLPILTPVMPL